jgi:hypothetical protein
VDTYRVCGTCRGERDQMRTFWVAFKAALRELSSALFLSPRRRDARRFAYRMFGDSLRTSRLREKFLDCPVEHRRIIRTTNGIPPKAGELRRRVKPMSTFRDVGSCWRLMPVPVRLQTVVNAHKLQDFAVSRFLPNGSLRPHGAATRRCAPGSPFAHAKQTSLMFPLSRERLG